MCVYTIVYGPNFKDAKDYFTGQEFRDAAMAIVKEEKLQGNMLSLNDDVIDECVRLLQRMGHVVMTY